jgi:hypothetical protein
MWQCIECSFALLVQNWDILWHPIEVEFSGWTKVLMALAKLHSFCIDESDVPLRERFHEDVVEGDEFDVMLNVFLDEGEHARASSTFLNKYYINKKRRNNECY